MAKVLPARAPDGWSRFDNDRLTIMVNEGQGSEDDLPAPPDGRFAVWPNGQSVVIGPGGTRLVLAVAIDAGAGIGMKSVFTEPLFSCPSYCGLHVVIRGDTDDHLCLERHDGIDLETEARKYAQFAIDSAAAEGMTWRPIYTTADDLLDLIVGSGAAAVLLDPPPGVTTGWGAAPLAKAAR
jgi:hypothetical protein